MKAFFEEFKKFALRGNVMDMAVGIIVGAAFTAIVTSLVDDLLSPLLGLLVRVNFSDLKVSVLGATFAYGNFIMAVINQGNEQNIITWQKGRGGKTYYQGMSFL